MRTGWYLAAVMVLVAPVARAETTAPRKFPSYLATPLLDHDAVVLPYVMPGHGAGKADAVLDGGKFRKSGLPAPSLDTIELGGKSMLRLDVAEAGSRAVSNVPDYTNVIVPLAPGKKRETPRYIGITLSTPTH